VTAIRTPVELGIEVRNARHEAGLTQAQLAQQASVSRTWIIRLERGEGGLEIERVFKVLRALGLGLRAEKQTARNTSRALDNIFRHIAETP